MRPLTSAPQLPPGSLASFASILGYSEPMSQDRWIGLLSFTYSLDEIQQKRPPAILSHLLTPKELHTVNLAGNYKTGPWHSTQRVEFLRRNKNSRPDLYFGLKKKKIFLQNFMFVALALQGVKVGSVLWLWASLGYMGSSGSLSKM